MKRIGLLLAIMLVIIANLVALSGAWYNRGGIPDAEVRLSERELALFSSSEDDSGVALRLEFKSEELDRAKLEELGFDGPPPGHDNHYRRWLQLFVVLELLEEVEEGSRLTARDVGLDREELRRSYPNRERYILTPGVVMIRHDPDAVEHEKLTGRIQRLLPPMIHVPKQHSGLLADLERGADASRYAVTLRYGRRLEPWVVRVEPLKQE